MNPHHVGRIAASPDQMKISRSRDAIMVTISRTPFTALLSGWRVQAPLR
jgi:hypothetical protein